MNRSVIGTMRFAVLALFLPTAAFAQRELHWDALQVAAHLDGNGTLQVVETQTMVFTGDWNGGERIFNIRPRQKVTLSGIFRDNGSGWQPLTEDSDLDSVDDYAWTDARTLRWRSRLRSNPPFANTRLRYELRYDLSGVLVADGTDYTLDHDFAFPDRDGAISRFELRLTLDPAWQSAEPLRDLYAASNLRPGQSFVLTLPLHFAGTGTPGVLDLSRPPAIRMAVLTLLVIPALAVAWFFVSEQTKGRFAPLVQEDGIDAAWLRDQILKHPAELVGAAWDDRIGQPEVVAVLARMTSEGKLRSEPSGNAQHASMTLHLKVDRDKLTGYERKLVDALFWDGRTTTTTDQVKSHYKTKGFNPVEIIEKDLEAALKAEFPFGDSVRHFRIETLAIFVIGLIALAIAFWEGYGNTTAMVILAIGSLLYAGLASLFGAAFRARMDWGRGNALLCLIPGLAAAAGAAWFLWYAGSGAIQLETTTVLAIACLALATANTSINSLKSRQHRGGLAARKKLAAARAFFDVQLRQRQPALHDEWYPWVLAFGLNKQMDDWSARAETVPSSDSSIRTSSSSTSSSSSHSWTGFGGGRSGGGGGGASWAAAAGGLAAGVSPPSSSSSGGGSSGGGGGGGGGGSSGGGGGGGW
jgi:uncharacterized membrane protein YgcG